MSEKKRKGSKGPPSPYNATPPPMLNNPPPSSLLPGTEITPEEEKVAERFVRSLKRGRPEVYGMLEEIERATGKRKTLIVSEALHHYILERRIIQSNLTVADLWEAWDLFVTFQEYSIKNFLRMGQLLFSEEYQSMLELVRTMHGEFGGVPAEGVKAAIPSKAEMIREELLEKLWRYMEPMLEWCIEQVMSNMSKAFNLKEPVRIPVGKKVPVKLIEEEE